MKVEKGLKVLEFGAEYFLHKAYLRNCPINTPSDHAKNDGKKNKEEKGQIIAELNDFLINPQNYKKSG